MDARPKCVMSHAITEFDSVGWCKNRHNVYNVQSYQQPEFQSLVHSTNPYCIQSFCQTKTKTTTLSSRSRPKLRPQKNVKATPRLKPCFSRPTPRPCFVNVSYIHNCHYIINMYLIETFTFIIGLKLYFCAPLFVIVIMI